MAIKFKKLIINLCMFFLFLFITHLIFDQIIKLYSMPIKIDIYSRINKETEYQIYYQLNDCFNENNSLKKIFNESSNYRKIEFNIPYNSRNFRIDFGVNEAEIEIKKIVIRKNIYKKVISSKDIMYDFDFNNFINSYYIDNKGIITIKTFQGDPFIVFKEEKFKDIKNEIQKLDTYFNFILKLVVSLLLFLSFKILYKKQLTKLLFGFIKDLLKSKSLIKELSINDFKKRYTGSYLGIIWAFINPVVITLTYWFVFQVGFKSMPIEKVPFILWFIAGLVPWFFISESIMNAMNTFYDYNYLVKKIVFKISILPIVKVISSLYVHIFFVIFTILLFTIYGYYPDLYYIQIIYYIFSMVCFISAVSLFNSTIIVFLKDWGQIVGILLQLLFWFTPIMWNINMIPNNYQFIFKLNPIYYVVQGYRDTFINKIIFIQRPFITLYFWTITFLIFVIGIYLYKKLKPHFPDIL